MNLNERLLFALISCCVVVRSGWQVSKQSGTSKQQTDPLTGLEDELITYQDTTLADVISGKGKPPVLFIGEDDTIFRAITKMNENKVGALLVQNEKGQTTGIVTERDYLTK